MYLEHLLLPACSIALWGQTIYRVVRTELAFDTPAEYLLKFQILEYELSTYNDITSTYHFIRLDREQNEKG